MDLCGVTYANCKDTTHLATDCEHNKFYGHSFERGKIAQSKVTYFESEFQLEDKEESIIHLMEESVIKALLNTGASTTVCGQKWLDIFEDSLTPNEKSEIEILHVRRSSDSEMMRLLSQLIKRSFPSTCVAKMPTRHLPSFR